MSIFLYALFFHIILTNILHANNGSNRNSHKVVEGNESGYQKQKNTKKETNLVKREVELYPNSNIHPSYLKNYEYLIETSARNNKIVCVEKEYEDLIYYAYDHKCDPQNTFSFSFNSTFKFDNDFYYSYEKSKAHFKEVVMTANFAVGSCISCFFLDEMNLLSIYGYTFVYKNSNETELKNEYEEIINRNIKNENIQKKYNSQGESSRSAFNMDFNLNNKNIYGADDTDTSHSITVVSNDSTKNFERNTLKETNRNIDETNLNMSEGVILHDTESKSNKHTKDSLKRRRKNKYQSSHLHSDYITLHKFLKENRINYTYDEIGKNFRVKWKDDISDTENDTDAYSDSVNSTNINMFDDFFEILNKQKNRINLKNMVKKKNIFNIGKNNKFFIAAEECEYLKEHFKTQKIWSNIIYINSFRNAKILSHIHKYKGIYSDFKTFNNEEPYRKIKLKTFIKETLDLHDNEYLSHNHVFFLIANEEINFVNNMKYCSDVFSDDPSTAYVKDPELIRKYKNLKKQFMSKTVYHQIFLLIALYANQKKYIFLLDTIKGNNVPLRLSIPFLFLITHLYFAQYNNIYLKDNIIGWVKRSKSLYAKTTRDILSIFDEGSYYADKTFNVLTVENKIISNLFIMELCHEAFDYVIFMRYNPLSNFSLYKYIGFESIILYMASSFTKEELTNIETYFKKLIEKDQTHLLKKKKKKRMNIYEIYVIPSKNYERFHLLLTKMFRAIFDCGGRHISKLLKTAVLRSHYDMLYNLNCYSYRLYALLRNIQDISKTIYNYVELDDLFKESQKFLLYLVDKTLKELENLIPFNVNSKYMIVYFVVILYYSNEIYCSDRENAIYLQIIYQYREFNLPHAIILSYLSQDKEGTLCTMNEPYENDNILDIEAYSNYTKHPDVNVYLKYDCYISHLKDNNHSACYLQRFNKKYFGDLHLSVRSQEILTIGLFVVSFTSTVNFFIGEFDEKLKKINVHRLFKNILINNFNYNITKYYTFWNSKLYILDQYEPECVLLFNKYYLYEKNHHDTDAKSMIAANKNTSSTDNKNHNDNNDDKNNALESEQQKNEEAEKKEITENQNDADHDRLYNNEKLLSYFSQKKQTCIVHEKIGKRHSSDFVVNEFLHLRKNFLNQLEKRNDSLYDKMLSYNFFNDPLVISKKTSGFKHDKMTNICKNIEVNKNRLCLLHKSKTILVYLYIMASYPELTYYVLSPLIFIKPYNHCDEYDIPLILNNMLKYKNFYKKSAKVCINYAFAHFISSRDHTSALNITAKIRGTMVNVSKRNLLLIMPLVKRVNILYHSIHNEYNIREEIVNEYFIWGNPHTPVNVKPYEFFKYDKYKKSDNLTIAGAFVTQYDGKYIIYNVITRNYDSTQKCTKGNYFNVDGKNTCFCSLLEHKFENKCRYPYCNQSQQYCAENEECTRGKCECIKGYSRNPMSSLCEKNNECVLDKGKTCKSPGSCVFLNKRYICLCPHPYIRILNTCLHPNKGIKIGLRIFNHFEDNDLHDRECAFKKEQFYINVFGSLSNYLSAAFNWIIEQDLKTRIFVQPVRKTKDGLQVTLVINRTNDPYEPTAVEVLRRFLQQLNDSDSPLNDGFFAYFARYTIIDYVTSFQENEEFFDISMKLENLLPKQIVDFLYIRFFSQLSFWGCFSFIIMLIVTFMTLTFLLVTAIKMKFSKKDNTHEH